MPPARPRNARPAGISIRISGVTTTRTATGTTGRRAAPRWLLAASLLWTVAPRAAELREVLDGLSRRHGFALHGLEYLGAEPVGEELPRGDPEAHVRHLLQRYNYLVVSGDGHRIEKVVIIGPKGAEPAAEVDRAVPIRRDGLHHRVEARLTGMNGKVLATSLILDTGASNVVLPMSMIEALGFRADDLMQTTSQTASGSVPVKVATLAVVAVGDNQAHDVAVSFVADRQLGDLRLLGMSFLRRFRVTIDDQNQRLLLIDR